MKAVTSAMEQHSEMNGGGQEEGNGEARTRNPRLFLHTDWLSQHQPEQRLDTLEVVKLFPEHKAVIRDTWAEILAHLKEYGIRVFLRIFELSPRIQAVFLKSFGHTDPDAVIDPADLVESEHLQDHVMRFMQAVQCAVEHMDELDEVVAPVFISLGRGHRHLPAIQQDYFSVFSGALMYVWRTMLGEDKFTPEVRAGWSRLFDFILQHLAFGCQLGPEEEPECKDTDK